MRQSELKIATDFIALYKALSGGWESLSSYIHDTTSVSANTALEIK